MTDQSLVEKEEEEDKVVLTMDHMSVGFTLWLGMLLIAFIMEFARFGLYTLFLRMQSR